jgi:hypothetical protein
LREREFLVYGREREFIRNRRERERERELIRNRERDSEFIGDGRERASLLSAVIHNGGPTRERVYSRVYSQL